MKSLFNENKDKMNLKYENLINKHIDLIKGDNVNLNILMDQLITQFTLNSEDSRDVVALKC